MIAVTLTWNEMMLAALAGIMRQVTNLRDGRRDYYGAEKRDGYGAHVEGAAGEMAVAKVLDRYWGGVGKFRGGDVGLLQVRTAGKHEYDLQLHPGDANDAIFVLVTGKAPRFRVRGWIRAREGKLPEYWCDRFKSGHPAYFVPVDLLHDIAELRPPREPGADDGDDPADITADDIFRT